MSEVSSGLTPGAVSRVPRTVVWRRRPWEIWSPQSPDDLVAVLSDAAGAEGISPMAIAGASGERGARERPLVIAGRDADRNPWRFEFRGVMRPGSGGTWLSGVVGPRSALLVTVLAWMSVVAVFFVSGVVAVVVGEFSGQAPLVVPWLVAPAVVLLVSFGLHRAAWASAEKRWRTTDEWLRRVVDAPTAP